MKAILSFLLHRRCGPRRRARRDARLHGGALGELDATQRRLAAWQGGPRRLLGVHLHQLDPHLALRQGVEPRLRRPRLGRGRRACARVRVRQARGEHRSGVRDHELTYPIALDNDFATWQAFGNNAWPAKYLFDAQGKLVKRWVGEGSYSDIEAEIRRLLVAARPGTKLPAVSPEAMAFAKTREPSYAGITAETYVGAERREPGTVTLEGNWQSARQYLELQKVTGKIVLPFTAGEVNLVMQPGPSGKAAVAVLLDGKPVGEARGADVGADGVARFDRSGMIRLVAR